MEWEEIAEAKGREIRRLHTVTRNMERDLARKNDMLFQVIEHARNEARAKFSDWKDADDWLFSNFDITKDELEEIYDGRGRLVYGGSCVDENDSQSEQNTSGQTPSM